MDPSIIIVHEKGFRRNPNGQMIYEIMAYGDSLTGTPFWGKIGEVSRPFKGSGFLFNPTEEMAKEGLLSLSNATMSDLSKNLRVGVVAIYNTWLEERKSLELEFDNLDELVEEVTETDTKMLDQDREAEKEDLRNLIWAHDIFYEWSDDMRIAREGRETQREIEARARKLGQDGIDIWNRVIMERMGNVPHNELSRWLWSKDRFG